MAVTPGELSRRHRELNHKHRCCHHKIAADLGLYYGQPILLMILLDHQRLSQTRLAAMLNNTPASVAVSVKRLEKAGLITKMPDAQDMRSNVIGLTPAGKDLAVRCRARWDRVDSALYNGFSEEEMDQLAALYERMSQNLDRVKQAWEGGETDEKVDDLCQTL